MACMAGHAALPPFASMLHQFHSAYGQLNIPEFAYDYHDYFSTIPLPEKLKKQEAFFTEQQQKLDAYKREALSAADKISYDHLQYEISFNLLRVSLETAWVNDGRKVPEGGLHGLKNYQDWYTFFIRRYTTLDVSPEQIFSLGLQEVIRVKEEIRKIQRQLGYADSAAFYRHLQSDEFYITEKKEIIIGFEHIDSIVRRHLPAFVGKVQVPPVYPMEWPDAGPGTPPGMYSNHAYNAYGKDVFQFNFYNKRYNRRSMEWLYMHEAIPGHHLQYSFRASRKASPLEELFLYPGNFEGWGCYIEYFGKDVGLFKDPYSYLGKWEWDLVRSARLVMDAGIHYFGWSHEQALAYWKSVVPGQDDIAEREVNRVTNWAAQALSYKVGADCIFKMREQWLKKHPGEEPSRFNRRYLEMGMMPLAVIQKDL